MKVIMRNLDTNKQVEITDGNTEETRLAMDWLDEPNLFNEKESVVEGPHPLFVFLDHLGKLGEKDGRN